MSRTRFVAIPYSLALRVPITTARERIERREGWWIAIRDEEGRVGLGEVAPLPGAGTETREEAEAMLDRLARSWSGSPPTTGETRATPACAAGVDLALLDLQGRREGRAIADLLGGTRRSRVSCHRLLRAVDPSSLADEAATAVAEGYRTLKIKVGARAIEEDAVRIAAVRSRVGTGISLRLDANRAYDLPTAVRAVEAFAAFAIEFIEEPAAEGVAEIRGQFPVRIAADESAASPEEAARLIDRRAVDLLILKPMAIGGPRAAIDLAHRALDAGIDSVVTSILESPIGIAGALHTACALPRDATCGLATAGYLADSPATGLPDPREGSLALPAGPGLGVSLDAERMREALS